MSAASVFPSSYSSFSTYPTHALRFFFFLPLFVQYSSCNILFSCLHCIVSDQCNCFQESYPTLRHQIFLDMVMIPVAKTSFSQTFDIIVVSFSHIRTCDLLWESLDGCMFCRNTFGTRCYFPRRSFTAVLLILLVKVDPEEIFGGPSWDSLRPSWSHGRRTDVEPRGKSWKLQANALVIHLRHVLHVPNNDYERCPRELTSAFWPKNWHYNK